MMTREEMWNAWKNDNCPAFRVADGPERKLVRRKRPIGDDIREHLAKGEKFAEVTQAQIPNRTPTKLSTHTLTRSLLHGFLVIGHVN